MGSAFLSVAPFGNAALDEALRAHQLDSTSFGHVELIPYKGHHLVPVVCSCCCFLITNPF